MSKAKTKKNVALVEATINKASGRDAQKVYTTVQNPADTARYKIDVSKTRHFKIGVFRRDDTEDGEAYSWTEIYSTNSLADARERVEFETKLPEYYA